MRVFSQEHNTMPGLEPGPLDPGPLDPEPLDPGPLDPKSSAMSIKPLRLLLIL